MKRPLAIAVNAVVPHLFSGSAHASERGGVPCPAGPGASVSDGMELRGVDQRKPRVAPLRGMASVDSAMTPLSTEPGITGIKQPVTDPKVVIAFGFIVPIPPADAARQRRTDQVSLDRFVADKVVHVWPRGMPVPATVGHSPKNGVACPSGFETTVLDKRGPRRIDTALHTDGRDLRVSQDMNGNRVFGPHTTPIDAGYVGTMDDPAQHGCALDSDRTGHGNVDCWVKDGTVFGYPVPR